MFDGKSNIPYREKDEPDPQNVYRKSKLAGEQAIQAVGVPHSILQYPTPAKLPGYSLLHSQKLSNTFELAMSE